MIFVNISTISPPLSLYPAAQRVTFLYYLGRFSLSNNHHLRAALCLQEAYVQTPAQFVSHRTNILTYLIPCNLLLGRFPSQQLLASPEAQSLAPIFYPLCQAVKTGDFVRFQHHLATHEAWLFDKGLLLTLTHRLRPLVWRSLTRRAFLLTYVPPRTLRPARPPRSTSPTCSPSLSTSSAASRAGSPPTPTSFATPTRPPRPSS